MIDIAGNRYGRLIAIAPAGKDRRRAIMWRCRCDCGNEAVICGTSLRNGHTRSCGCLHDELSAVRCAEVGRSTRTHGQSRRTPTYISWEGMHQRCAGSKGPESARYYADRGVTVCERWRSFENFLADMGERPDGKTLDRTDPYGNYEPSNCRWATPKEQRANRRRGRIRWARRQG